MNLQGRFFVRSNYIRAAKDDWILCDVRLLSDELDTFLCIKSLFLGNLGQDDDAKSTLSGFTAISAVSSQQQSPTFRPFTALCNLSEYKSCSMRTVTVRDQAYFALKFVPSGALSTKRLFLAIPDENELTTWLACCKASIGKKSKASSHAGKDSTSTAGTLSRGGSLSTLKPEHGAPLEVEFDETLLDNEVYEAYSADDVIPAIVEETGDWTKLQLSRPECYIRLKDERLELLDGVTQRLVHWFPYLLIRRFGAANGVLRVDAGRRCSTGDGRFFFRCSPPNGQQVDALVTQIRQLALEAKQRLKQAQMTRSSIEFTSQHSISSSDASTHRNGTDTVNTSVMGSLESSEEAKQAAPIPPLAVPVVRSHRQRSEKSSYRNTSDGSAGDLKIEDSQRSSGNINMTDEEVFKAAPFRVSKGEFEHLTSPGVYDNIPRHPRSKFRPVGGVNVLPLPTKARAPVDRSGDGVDRNSRSSTRASSPPGRSSSVDCYSPSNLPMAPKPPASSDVDDELRNPTYTIETETDVGEKVRPSPTPTQRSTTSSGYQQPIVRSLSHPPPPLAPPSSTTTTTTTPTTSTTSTAVMRVPPLTAPKPRMSLLSRNSQSADGRVSLREDSFTEYPVPLSNILATKVSSTTLYLKGPHPGSKEGLTNGTAHTSSLSEKNLDPAIPVRQKSHPESTSYLSELDSVIRELCEANEAAVQATKEAARRRHQLGWPPPFHSKQSEDSQNHVSNGGSVITKSSS